MKKGRKKWLFAALALVAALAATDVLPPVARPVVAALAEAGQVLVDPLGLRP